MSEDETVVVGVVGRQVHMSRYVRLFLREALEVPSGPLLRNDTHVTQRFAALDDSRRIDPRHNKKILPKTKWRHNYR